MSTIPKMTGQWQLAPVAAGLFLCALLITCSPVRDNANDPDSPFYVGPSEVDRAVRPEVENLSAGSPVQLVEGKSMEVALRLKDRPLSNAEVTVSVSDSDTLTVDGGGESVLVFTPDNFATRQYITIEALPDENLTNEAASVSFASKLFPTETFQLELTDKDTLSIVAAGLKTLVEGSSTPLAVSLTRRPENAVTVNLSHNGGNALGLSKSKLIFQPDNYDSPQNVQVTASEDADVYAEQVKITLSAQDAEADTVFTITTTENDPGIVFNAGATNITEGTSTSLEVSLVSNPGGPITVDLYSTEYKSIVLSSYQLEFHSGNYSVPQTLSVYAQDDINLANENTVISATAVGMLETSLGFTAVDNDTQNIVLSGPISVDEGYSITVTVVLTNQPASNVLVDLEADQPGSVLLNTAQLTFTPTNYAVEQEITLFALEDANGTPETAVLTATSTGLATADHHFDTVDNDPIVVFGGATSVVEGSTAVMTVALSKELGAGVTVSLSSDNTNAITLSDSTLFFGAGSATTPQNVTLTGVTDSDAVLDTAVISGSGLNLITGQRTITNLDDTREILAFQFIGSQNAALASTVNGVVDSGMGTIDLAVPYSTTVTNLRPTITFDGNTTSPASGSYQNFATDLTYTVYAHSGNSDSYTVAVRGHDAQDLGNGTVRLFISGATYIWKKCSQGQTDDATCSGSASTYQYCDASDNSCNALFLIGTGNSEAFDTCDALNGLNYGGYSYGWQVPRDWLLGDAIPIIDKYPNLFPNSQNGYYWSSDALNPATNEEFAIMRNFPDAFQNWIYKSFSMKIRCVQTY